MFIINNAGNMSPRYKDGMNGPVSAQELGVGASFKTGPIVFGKMSTEIRKKSGCFPRQGSILPEGVLS